MLHYYFRTKDKLFERIVTEKMGLLSEIMLSAIEESDLPLPDKIRQGVERHFDFLTANPDLPRFIVNEIYSRPERIKLMTGELQPTATRVLHNLQTEIDRCAAQGLCRHPNPAGGAGRSLREQGGIFPDAQGGECTDHTD